MQTLINLGAIKNLVKIVLVAIETRPVQKQPMQVKIELIMYEYLY